MSAQRQRYVICHCPICDGALVPPRTKRTHANTQARTQTTQLGGASRISKDGQVSAIVPMSMLPVPPPSAAHYTVPLREPEALIDQFPTLTVFPRTSSSAVEQEMIDHGSLTWEDIDLQTFGSALPNLGPNFHDPESLLQYVEHHEGLNAATAAASRPLTAREAHLQPPEVTGTADEPSVAEMIESAYRQELTRTDGGQDDGEGAWSDPDRDDMDNDDDDEDDDQTGGGDSADPTPGELSHPSVTLIDEDSPDPFLSESSHSSQTSSIALLPPHIMCIYSLVTWLHLFFHLPRAACNALLSGLALLVFFLNPNVATPFVTLSAANRALGLEFPIHILPVCPGCKEVFPMSDKTHEACTACGCQSLLTRC
ncbi:hypothetical protein PLICRDRAFT_577787 [Plicaturopsis crispa FD-325 SS-3]|nr:hypothetical protein PLICRDRAFT_577787 [Plicaturopsis crispa FD-325 SS-3]